MLLSYVIWQNENSKRHDCNASKEYHQSGIKNSGENHEKKWDLSIKMQLNGDWDPY